MRRFRLKNTGEVIAEYDYRCQFPNTTFSQTFVPDDADVIQEAEKPTLLPAQICVDDGIEKVGDAWVSKWAVVDVVPESVAYWRAQAVIDLNNLRPIIEAFIDEIEDSSARIIAKSKFVHSSVMERKDPIILGMIQRGLLTNEAVDAMFIAAERLA